MLLHYLIKQEARKLHLNDILLSKSSVVQQVLVYTKYNSGVQVKAVYKVFD